MEYDFEIQWIPGKDNLIADGLSHLVNAESTMKIREIKKIKIPSPIYNKLQSIHNFREGHSGVERTVRKLQQMLTSDHTEENMLKSYTTQFIKFCPACQKMSQLKAIIKGHPFTYVALNPMERINIDTIGPVQSQNDTGYILVIIDCFSRFVELYYIKDTTAEEAAKALLAFVGRYGSPLEMMSDRGSQFVNEIIAEFCKITEINQTTTIAYSKEQNGIVERANKEVMRHLRNIIFDLKNTTGLENIFADGAANNEHTNTFKDTSRAIRDHLWTDYKFTQIDMQRKHSSTGRQSWNCKYWKIYG